MKQIDPNKVYGDVPQSFSHRVDYALRRTREKEEAKSMKRKPLVAVIITVLMIALTTTAVAAGLSKTIEFFVFEYGERVREKMESGTVAPGGQFAQLNDAVFTLADAVVIPDQINWTRLDAVEVDGENWVLKLRITLEADTCYVSVNYYYTIAMLQKLRSFLSDRPWAEELTIGSSRDGQPLRLYKVTDPAVPAEKKKLIYLQGGQHCCEFGGMHLCDAILRYVCGDSAEAAQLRQKYEFHVLPVVSLADWSDGYTDELLADSNTVWDTLSTCETKAIDSYLRSLLQKPALLIDCHNAQETSFLICADYVSPERVQQQKRFADLVADLCDCCEKGSESFSKSEKYANFKQYALLNFGYGFTLELSRFGLYDRRLGERTPLCRESFLRLGSQLPHAMDAFLKEL